MFGIYGCLDTNARGCCMLVFLVSVIDWVTKEELGLCEYMKASDKWVMKVVGKQLQERIIIKSVWRRKGRKTFWRNDCLVST